MLRTNCDAASSSLWKDPTPSDEFPASKDGISSLHPFPSRDAIHTWLTAIYFLEGFGLLGMESVWIRTLGLHFGNTSFSMNAAIVLFLIWGGLGNGIGGWSIPKISSPLRLFALSEMAAGITAAISYDLFSPFLLKIGNDFPHEIRLLLAGSFLIGPPSFFLGITLPALTEWGVQKAEDRILTGGRFYLANLVGATVGVGVGGLLFPFLWGYRTTYLFCAGGVWMGGVLAWLFGRRAMSNLPTDPTCTERTRFPGTSPSSRAISFCNNPLEIPLSHLKSGWVWWLIFLAGTAMMSFELLFMLLLALTSRGTIYFFQAVLFAQLVGISAGTALATGLRKRGWMPREMIHLFLPAAGISLILFLFFLPLLPMEWSLSSSHPTLTVYGVHLFTGALFLGLPPALLIAAFFPPTWELLSPHTPHNGRFFGQAMALYKIGTAAGLVGVIGFLTPVLGFYGTTAALGCLLLLTWVQLSPWRWRWMLAVVVLCAGVVIGQRDVNQLQQGERLLESREGPRGLASVVVDRLDSRHILLNRHYQLNGTGDAMSAQRHEGWLPALFAPRLDRVLFIGMASGISAAAVLDFPVKRLMAVEIDPDVTALAERHFRLWNDPLFSDPRSQVLIQDGRQSVRLAEEPFDLVIADLFCPWHPGSAGMYGRDFFREVREKLSEKGCFCLWLPLFQLDRRGLEIVMANFAREFPYAIAIRGTFDPVSPILGLLGSPAPIECSANSFESRLMTARRSPMFERSPFLRSGRHVLLALFGDLQAASEEFKDVPDNTDDHPLLAFHAPEAFITQKTLRGIFFLQNFGNRFHGYGFSSLTTTSDPFPILRNALAAGNNYFAAAAMAIPHPDSFPQRDRQRRSWEYLLRAWSLDPSTQMDLEDLFHRP